MCFFGFEGEVDEIIDQSPEYESLSSLIPDGETTAENKKGKACLP